jgi:hypothetical protein
MPAGSQGRPLRSGAECGRARARRQRSRVGVRHELGDDLREVDPGLREVLAKVTSTDAAVAQLRGVDCHGQRISASDDGSRPATPLPCPCGSERKYKHDDDVAKELDRSSEN